jgi:membrane carboxypeptidase/penicillin-binding protein PbpC
MLAAHRRGGEAEAALARPDSGLELRDVCGLSGEAANSWCPVRRREWLPIDHQSLPCSWHLSAVASAKVDHQADEGLLTVWPAEFRDWAARRAQTIAPPAAETSGEPAVRHVAMAATATARPTRAKPAIRMSNPPTGATYLIDPTLRPEFQTLPLRVVSAAPTRIEWSVNGSRLGTASSESALEWRLRPGRHSIVARDPRGNVAESVVVVR